MLFLNNFASIYAKILTLYPDCANIIAKFKNHLWFSNTHVDKGRHRAGRMGEFIEGEKNEEE
jgi:hypothetical protein